MLPCPVTIERLAAFEMYVILLVRPNALVDSLNALRCLAPLHLLISLVERHDTRDDRNYNRSRDQLFRRRPGPPDFAVHEEKILWNRLAAEIETTQHP